MSRSEEIQLTHEEVGYILRLHNIWIRTLEEGPLISFSEWVLEHEIPGTQVDPGDDPGEEKMR